MTDRDRDATTPATAPTVEMARDDGAPHHQAHPDGHASAGHEPAPISNPPKRPFYRTTGGIIGLSAVALLLLGLIFGAGFAAGSISSAVFGPDGNGRGASDGVGPRGGDGPGGMPGRDADED